MFIAVLLTIGKTEKPRSKLTDEWKRSIWHKLGATMHNCDLSTYKKEAEGPQFKVILGNYICTYIHTYT